MWTVIHWPVKAFNRCAAVLFAQTAYLEIYLNARRGGMPHSTAVAFVKLMRVLSRLKATMSDMASVPTTTDPVVDDMWAPPKREPAVN